MCSHSKIIYYNPPHIACVTLVWVVRTQKPHIKISSLHMRGYVYIPKQHRDTVRLTSIEVTPLWERYFDDDWVK